MLYCHEHTLESLAPVMPGRWRLPLQHEPAWHQPATTCTEI